MNKKKNLILSLLAVLTVIIITGGVTYAFFSYTKTGTTDNVLTTDTITFLYTEVDGVGNGIKIENTFPMSDEKGKVLTKTNEYFDFKVTSKTASTIAIPYEVTARKSSDSDDIDEYIRVYLTKGETNEEVLLENYDKLAQTDKVDASKWTEKTIWTGKVPSNTPDYEETFRLRMWIDEDTRFDTTDMNNKTFTLTVNVYANAKVVTEEEIALENKAEIKTLTIEGTELTAVEGQDYDYETTLPEDTTSTTINIETESPNAKVTVEKVDSLAKTNNIKRLAVTKTLELTNGDNYFKVTVTSENKKIENEFKLRIYVGQEGIALGDAILNKYSVIETTPNFKTTSAAANENGLYKSTLTNSGNPTYYFRGNVENYLDFAGFTWRVVRINEDGTIRIVLQNGINDDATYAFNTVVTSKDNMYYTNSDTAKPTLEDWYDDKIASNTTYANRVATGDYYCEAAKVVFSDIYASNSGASMTAYTAYENPNFECKTDGNTKGIVRASVGLLSYDEVLHAGGYHNKVNDSYYLYNNTEFWTMSPAGISGTLALEWYVHSTGIIGNEYVNTSYRLRPVLNLKADTAVTGLGTSDSHWSVSN